MDRHTGENIAWITPGMLAAQETVDMWMSEARTLRPICQGGDDGLMAALYNWNKPGYDGQWLIPQLMRI